MNSIYRIFVLTALILPILACGDGGMPEKRIVSGIGTNEYFYTSDSFINYETMNETFENNGLDFLVFGLKEGASNDGMESFRSTVKGVERKLHKEKRLFSCYPLFSEELYEKRALSGQSIFFMSGTNGSREREIPLIYRDAKANFLFNTLSIKYDGEVDFHIDDYFGLLDRGYILGAFASAEIIGPEWKLRNSPRMFILTDETSPQGLKDALRKRRTYVSMEPDTDIYFYINNAPMGTIINGTVPQIHFNYSIKNDRDKKIGRVELVTNNDRVIYSKENVSDVEIKERGTLSLSNSFIYIYLRLYFENGNVAFTTPIWIKRGEKYILNNINQTYNFDRRQGRNIEVSLDIENISNSKIHNVKILMEGHKGKQVFYNEFDLKNREIKEVKYRYYFDTTADEALKIKVFKDSFFIEEELALKKYVNTRKVVFDASHNNLYSSDLNYVNGYLKRKRFQSYIIEDSSFFLDYDNLKDTNLIIITVPLLMMERAELTLTFLNNLHKYVYYGGSIIVAGSNVPEREFSVNFLNEILRVVYSPVKFRYDEELSVYPIYDETLNFKKKRNVPVFHNFNREIIKNERVKKIYLRDPLEIYATNGERELSMKRHYRVKPLVYYSDSTEVERRTLYKKEEMSPAAVYTFGEGKVAVLSGINFNDYDFVNYNNREWFLELVNYLVE